MNTRRPMVARSGEDLLAMLPVLFGFQPEQSLALVCAAPTGGSMHARVDLGRTRAEVLEALDMLLTPASLNGVSRAVLCVLTDLATAESWRPEITAACRAWDGEILQVVAADGHRWRPLGSSTAPQEYDVWSHPLVAQAVLEGRMLLPSRAALADTLAPSPGRVARVRDRLALDPSMALVPAAATALVSTHADAGTLPDSEETAVLLATLRDPAGCLEVAAATARQDAPRQLAVWTAVVQAAPEGWVEPAASVLGFVAWLAGEGALAWCAVDRARPTGDERGLLPLVVQLLEGAVPPDAWDAHGPGSGPVGLPRRDDGSPEDVAGVTWLEFLHG